MRDDPVNRLLADGGPSIDRLRDELARRIAAALDHDPYTGIIQALSIGVRDGIHAEQWAVLTGTGTITW